MTTRAPGAIVRAFQRVRRATEAALEVVLDWVARAVLVAVLVTGCLLLGRAAPGLLLFALVMAWTLWCDGD